MHLSLAFLLTSLPGTRLRPTHPSGLQLYLLLSAAPTPASGPLLPTMALSTPMELCSGPAHPLAGKASLS
jgi:hypothetical protein